MSRWARTLPVLILVLPVATATAAEEIHGLKGQYFLGRDLETLKLERIDTQLDFNWSREGPTKDFPHKNISIRWTGAIEAQYSELYTFHTLSDDGVRLWVNDRLLIDNWGDHGATEDTGSIRLEAGRRYNLRLEYYQGAGEGVIKLLWSSPSQRKQIIPHAYLLAQQMPRPEPPPMRLPALEIPSDLPALSRQANWNASVKAYEALGVPRSWLILAPQPDRQFRLFSRKTPLEPEKTDNWRNLLQDPAYLPTLWTRPEEEEPGDGLVEADRILEWAKPGLTYARTDVVWPVDGRARIWFSCRERGTLFLNNSPLLDLDQPARMPCCITVDLKRGTNIFKVKLGTQGGPWGFSFRIERDDPEYRVMLLRRLLEWHPRSDTGPRRALVHLEIARYLEEAGRKREAGVEFRNARQRYGLDPEVRVEADEAERRLQEKHGHPPAAKAWPVVAADVNGQFSRGECAAADATLRLFIARYPRTPESIEALVQRGQLRRSWDFSQESLEFYDRAMRESPRHPAVLKVVLPSLELAFRQAPFRYAAETTPELLPLLEAARRQFKSDSAGDLQRARRNLDAVWELGADLFILSQTPTASVRHAGTALAIRQLAEHLEGNVLDAYGRDLERQASTHAGALQETLAPTALVDLAARYPRTTVALEALNRAANNFLDTGRWTEAEAMLDRLSTDAASLKLPGWLARAALKRAGLPTTASSGQRQTADLRALAGPLRSQTLAFRGKEMRVEQVLRDQASWPALTRPEDGTSPRGPDPSRRNVSTKILQADLRPAWRVPLPLSSLHLRACARLNQTVPLLRYPIVAENRVFVAQPEMISAFDLSSGELQWRNRFDASEPAWPNAFGGYPTSFPSYANGLLFMRVIERGRSELRAFSAEDGHLCWRSGMDASLDNLLWLGDPASACASVFAVFIERVQNGPSRHGVACLDGHTGALRWKRYILSGNAEWHVGDESWLPPLYQGPPAVAKGVVYAATGLGSLVALDAFTGHPLWLASYTAPHSGNVSADIGFRSNLNYFLRRGPDMLQVRDDTVFLAPKDAPGLFAFNAHDGSLQWGQDLCDGLHLFAGMSGSLFVAGRSGLQLNPSDGSEIISLRLPESAFGHPDMLDTQLCVCDREGLQVHDTTAPTAPGTLAWEQLGIPPMHSCTVSGPHLILLNDEEIVLLSDKGVHSGPSPLEQARAQADRGNWAEAGRCFAVAMRRQPNVFLEALSGWASAHLRIGFERRALSELDYWLTNQRERLVSSNGFWEVLREALRIGLRARLGQLQPPPPRTLPRGLSSVLAFAGHIPMEEPNLVVQTEERERLIFASERYYISAIALGPRPGVQWRTYHGLESPRFTVGPTVVLVWSPQQLFILDRLTGEPLRRITVPELQAPSSQGQAELLVAAAVNREVVLVATQNLLACIELSGNRVRWIQVAKGRHTVHLGLTGGRAVEVSEGKTWTYRSIDLVSGQLSVSKNLEVQPQGFQMAASPDGRSLVLCTDEEHLACLDLDSGDWRWKARLRKFKRDRLQLDWEAGVVRCASEAPGDSKASVKTVELRAQDGEVLREYDAMLWPVDSDFVRCVNREDDGLDVQRLHLSGIPGATPRILWKYDFSPELSHGGTLRGIFPDDRGDRIHLLFVRRKAKPHFVLRTFDWPRGYFVHEEILPGQPLSVLPLRRSRTENAGIFEDLLVYTAKDGIYLYRSAGATRREAAALLDRQLPLATTGADRKNLRQARAGVDPPLLHVLRGPDSLRLWTDTQVWEHADPLLLNSRADYLPFQDGAVWRGPDDLSARAQVLWNASGLLVAVSVTDDCHDPARPGAPLETGDALRLSIDATADGREGPDPSAQWSATLSWDHGRTTFRSSRSTYTDPESVVEGGAMPLPNGQGMRYEVQIPWALLRHASSLRPGNARQLRFGLAVYDSDGKGVHGAMEWGAGTTLPVPFTPWLGELSLLDISREWMDRYREVIAKLPDAPEALFFLRRLVLSHRGPLAAANQITDLESFIKAHPASPNVVPVLQMLYNAFKDLSIMPQARLLEVARGASCPEPLRRQLESWPHPSGPGTGLQGEYFDNQDFTGLRGVRVDAALNFNWDDKAPMPGMTPTGFSVRWTGMIAPRYSEEYTFYTLSDDGVRLWVDNRLLIDNWTDHPTSEDYGRVILTAGALYDVKIEYFQGLGGARFNFLWSSHSQTREMVPTKCLYPSGLPFLPPPHYEVDPERQRDGYRQAALLLASTPEGLLFFNRLLDTYPEDAHTDRIQECENYLKNQSSAIHAGSVLRKLLDLYAKAGREPVSACQTLMQSCRIQQHVQREFYREYVPAWSKWHLLGPLSSGSLENGMEQVLPPERLVDLKWETANGADDKIGWKESSTGKTGGNGFVDLNRRLTSLLSKTREKGFDNGPRVAYAFRKIRVSRQRRALFLFGAEECISIWLNGTQVARQETPGSTKDAQALDVTLKEGDNEILLKVGTSGEKWGFFFRASDPNGCPLPDLPAD